MFTPQRWSGWSRTPRTGAEKTGTGSGAPNSNSGDGIVAKGKGVNLFEPATPVSGSMLENVGKMLVESGGAATDREVLAHRVSELENELFEYQYNMGLLLIEKKEWTSKYEEVRQSLNEAKEAVRREQSAHLIAMTEIEKREENLRKALGVEKQCVHDLEKALHEIRSENAEIKFTAESKLAEANALVASVEEKSLELEAKMRAADAKLAEEYDGLRMNLEMKEKELLVWEENLNAKEKVEIQKLIDEHNAMLDAKKCEFELEIDERRKSLDDELRNRAVDVEKKESEINHLEEKIAKREQALEKKAEKLREKENDFETKVKSLKEKEKSVKSEEKNLESEKKQLVTDKEDLVRLLAEVEKIRADNEEQLQKISEQRDLLKVTEEERSDYLRLQSELKQEIDKYRQQKELLLKEAEDLKQQKELFEREWEELDDKRVEIEKELKNVGEQKEKIEKWKHAEEERLKNERVAAQHFIDREQGDLKLARESFAAHMEHEKSELAEKAQSERSQMLHEFETRKRELETDMQNRLEEMEKPLREREKSFAEEQERELDNVNYLREVARREMEEIKVERLKIEKERQEADANKEHLERQQVEIRKDIDGLLDLSRKLRDQREQFIKERESFISFIEKLKSCTNCGEMILEFVQLRPLAEIENAEVIPQPRLSDDYLKGGLNENLAASKRQKNESPASEPRSPVSGGTISWLRKCTTKIFNLSPGKKIEFGAPQNSPNEAPFPGEQNEEPSERVHGTENEAEISLGVASDSFDVQRIQSDNSIREVEVVQYPSHDEHSNMNSEAPPDVPEDSQPSDLKGSRRKPSRSRRPAVNRARTKKAVVKDAKAILGEADSEYANGTAEDSVDMQSESLGGSSLADKRTTRNGRKRGRAETSQIALSDGGDSERLSDIVMGSQRKKKREKVLPAEQVPGESRYNLRRPKTGVRGAAATASRDLVKENEEVDGARGTEAVIHYSKAAPATSMGVVSENGGSSHFVRCETLANTQDGDADAVKNQEENPVASEEVNGSTAGGQEYVDGDEYRSESREATPIEEDDDDDEEESSEHPGQASIGKKLWTFLTT
ncbi:hypothetical protein C1H46_040103 [Malus baccata]|uniref:Nuclear matrix constituent protein 1-like protein n=1 Tax=Malus baccata TaxID=106549 RepID=A0A540KJK0_MALBA|nr:hypothetical protein C1H46_040103 [Malus baccata]